MAEHTDIVAAWTTLPPEADAAAFARRLVEDRVAACVTVQGPVRSIYRWQGAIEEEPEQLVLIKTTRARVAALRERVVELHPYDVPELIVVPVIDGNAAYLRWVAESTHREFAP